MRFKGILFFLAVFICLTGIGFAAEDALRPQGWVNDFAGVISPEYKEKINFLISEAERKTSAEIVVVTVDSVAPADEKAYARLLFDKWKPGKKGKDNGVLVLVAVKDRLWRIETGYGIEPVLTDAVCWQAGQKYMAPYFKQGQYGQGLYEGVSSIFKLLTGELAVADIQEQGQDNDTVIFFIILILIAVLFIARRRFGFFGGGGYYGGGTFGGGGSGGFGGGSGGGGGAGGKF